MGKQIPLTADELNFSKNIIDSVTGNKSKFYREEKVNVKLQKEDLTEMQQISDYALEIAGLSEKKPKEDYRESISSIYLKKTALKILSESNQISDPLSKKVLKALRMQEQSRRFLLKFLKKFN